MSFYLKIVLEEPLSTVLAVSCSRPYVEKVMPASFPNQSYNFDLTEGKDENRTGKTQNFLYNSMSQLLTMSQFGM